MFYSNNFLGFFIIFCLLAGNGSFASTDLNVKKTEFCEYSVQIPKGDLDCPVAHLSRHGQSQLRSGVSSHVTDIAKLKTSNMTLTSLLKDVIEQLKEPKYDGIKRQLNYLLPVVKQDNPNVVHSGDPDAAMCKESEQVPYLKDCFEILKHGHFGSGVYYIKPDLLSYPLPVFCDMETTTGGWLVITRRVDGSLNFTKNWDAYKKGFGKVDKEFWFGNDNIFLLTHQKNYTLRIDVELFNGNKLYFQYKNFTIGAEIENYRLNVVGYSGSYAYDALTAFHNHMSFKTYDRGVDCNCGKHKGAYLGGWWFKCPCSYRMLLTGAFPTTAAKGFVLGHTGKTWLRYKKAEMKIRPYM